MSLTSIILAAVILWGSSMAATGWWFYGAGKDAVTAQQAREDRIAQVATDAAASAAARAIAGIEVRNTTIHQATERIVRENTVFRECRSGPDAVRLLNASPAVAASGAVSAGGGELPAAGASR